MIKCRTLVPLVYLVAAACSGYDAMNPQHTALNVSATANSFSPAYFDGTITVLPATATLSVGSTLALNGSIHGFNNIDLTAILGPDVVVSSSDTTIATVTDSGIVTGLRAGVDTISVQLGSVVSHSVITVVGGNPAPVADSLHLYPKTATLAVGYSLALNGNIKSADGTDLTMALASTVTLTSSDYSIATVSQRGIVAGLRPGVAVITAQVGGLSSTSTITVIAVDTAASSSTSGSGSTSTSGSGSTSTSGSGSTSTSGSAAGSGSGVSSVALVSDDYTHYSSTQDLLSNISSNIGGTGTPGSVLYNDGFNPQLLALDNTVTYNGHPTVKYNQPGGTAATPQLWVTFPAGQTLTNMWIRTKVRFGPGFTTTGTLTTSANAYKLLGWGWYGTDGRGSLEFTNTNQYVYEWYVTNTAQTEEGQATLNGAHTTTEWTGGQWFDYIVHYTQTSSTTISMTWWLAPDGQTPVQQQTVTGSMTAGQVPPVNRVLLGLNFNQIRTASQSQALWYGQWEVVDGSKYSNPFGL